MFTLKQNGDELIGKPSQNAARLEAERTFYDAKRLIGRKFDETEVQNNLQFWPFKVV